MIESRQASTLTQAAEAWNTFWFTPRSSATITVFRIAVGLVSLAWILSLLPNMHAFFSTGGVVASIPEKGPRELETVWTLFMLDMSETMTWSVTAVIIIASLLVIAGLWPTLASILLFVGVFSMHRRNPWILNSGDTVHRLQLIFLMLMPLRATPTVSRIIAGFTPASCAAWALRMAQVQLTVIYLATAAAKMFGETWWDGTAVGIALQSPGLAHLPVPLAQTETISALLTYGTLGLELALPVLLWIPRTRQYAVIAGILLHLGILYALRVGFFSIFMIIMYIPFVDDGTWERLLTACGRKRGARQ